MGGRAPDAAHLVLGGAALEPSHLGFEEAPRGSPPPGLSLLICKTGTMVGALGSFMINAR